MLILQVDPVEAVNKVTGLTSEWAILVALAIVIIFQGYKLWLDNKNSKEDKLDRARMEILLTAVERYLKILAEKYTDEVSDIQLPVLVNSFIGNCRGAILTECAASITKNNVINNKTQITFKITSFVNNRYNDMLLAFSRFKYHGKPLDSLLPDTCDQSTIDDILGILLRERDTEYQKMEAYRQLGSYIDQRFDAMGQKIMLNVYDV